MRKTFVVVRPEDLCAGHYRFAGLLCRLNVGAGRDGSLMRKTCPPAGSCRNGAHQRADRPCGVRGLLLFHKRSCTSSRPHPKDLLRRNRCGLRQRLPRMQEGSEVPVGVVVGSTRAMGRRLGFPRAGRRPVRVWFPERPRIVASISPVPRQARARKPKSVRRPRRHRFRDGRRPRRGRSAAGSGDKRSRFRPRPSRRSLALERPLLRSRTPRWPL